MAESARELLKRDVSPELYRRVLEEWKTHSVAEDQRDIAGLMSTLTVDCVYELVQTGDRWEGHAGATRFYQELLGAFPDIRFDLTNIVVGPQGVSEEANVTGTFRNRWLAYPPTGQRVEFKVVIFFPWDPARGKFRGERIYFHAGDGFPAAARKDNQAS